MNIFYNVQLIIKQIICLISENTVKKIIPQNMHACGYAHMNEYIL